MTSFICKSIFFVFCIRCNYLNFWITPKCRISCNAVYSRLPHAVYASYTKSLPCLSLVKHFAFRIGDGFIQYFLFCQSRWPLIIVILLQRFLSMRCATHFDFLIQLLLTAFRRTRYSLFTCFFLVCICFPCHPSTNIASGDSYPAQACFSKIRRNTPSVSSAVIQ